MLGNGKDQVPKCLGAPSEFSIAGKFLGNFLKTIVDTTCPYFYLDNPQREEIQSVLIHQGP
jgi:hypothetical protein